MNNVLIVCLSLGVARDAITIQKSPLGTRGWCYILEGALYRLLNKEKFSIVGDSIARCRHKGYLPWDFCVEYTTRVAINIQEPDFKDIEEFIWSQLGNTIISDKYYEMNF